MFQRCVETTLHISSQSQNPSRVAVESDLFLHKSLMSHHDLKIQNYFLVGGFSPVEKYESNWESSPNRDENKKYLKPPASILIPESRFEKKKTLSPPHLSNQVTCSIVGFPLAVVTGKHHPSIVQNVATNLSDDRRQRRDGATHGTENKNCSGNDEAPLMCFFFSR